MDCNNDKLVLEMTVRDDSNFLSVFSQNENPVISNEVADFLENSLQGVNSKKEVSLVVHSKCIDELEQKEYKKGIEQYYKNKLISVNHELRQNVVITMVLAIIGIIILVAAIFIENRFSSVLWTEVLDIMAWVFLWEAVDIWAFKNKHLKLQRKKYTVLSSMTVTYTD